MMLIKIGMRKAYDRLEWVFIIKALRFWGFFEDFRRLSFSCISSVEFIYLSMLAK